MIIRPLIAFPFPRRYAQPIKAGLLTLGSNEVFPFPFQYTNSGLMNNLYRLQWRDRAGLSPASLLTF